MSEQMTSVRDENDALTTKVGKLQDEINTLLVQISVFQSVAEDAEARLNSRTKDYEQQEKVYEEQLTELQQQLSQVKSSHDVVSGAVLTRAAFDTNNRNEDTVTKYSEDDVDQLNKKIAQLITELSFERNRCEVLEDDLLKLSFNPVSVSSRQQTESLKDDEVQVSAAVAAATSEITAKHIKELRELEHKIDDLDSELNEKDKLIHQLRTELQQTQHELEKGRY